MHAVRATPLLLALLGLLYMGCSPGLHFRRTSVLGATYDAEEQSTRVRVTFEVWNSDQQLTGLSRESFRVYEDGNPTTSEAMSAAATEEQRVPVVLLLDTSLSMYQANAIGELKRAAERFVSVLSDNGFEVTVFRFASQIEQVTDIAAIPEDFDDGGERWTSLYAAVQQGFASREDAIVVVFSDGADNYSQNHDVPDLGAVEGHVRSVEDGGNGARRVLHAIGFGAVGEESDRQQVPASQALERLSVNGSFQFADQPGALDQVFQDVADRIRNVYIYEYLSPNLDGAHTIAVEVTAAGQTTRTETLPFHPRGDRPSYRMSRGTSGSSPEPSEEQREEGRQLEARIQRDLVAARARMTAQVYECSWGAMESCVEVARTMTRTALPPELTGPDRERVASRVGVSLQGDWFLRLAFRAACGEAAGSATTTRTTTRTETRTATGTTVTETSDAADPAADENGCGLLAAYEVTLGTGGGRALIRGEDRRRWTRGINSAPHRAACAAGDAAACGRAFSTRYRVIDERLWPQRVSGLVTMLSVPAESVPEADRPEVEETRNLVVLACRAEQAHACEVVQQAGLGD